MRVTSSCPRRTCRRLYHLLLISLAVCLKGTTTLAASSIPPLSVLNSRRVSAVSAGNAAASTASFARDRRLAPFLGSCRGGAAAAAAVTATPVETQKGIGPMEIFLHTIKEARRHLAAAAVARSVSIFGMCEFMATYICLDWCHLHFCRERSSTVAFSFPSILFCPRPHEMKFCMHNKDFSPLTMIWCLSVLYSFNHSETKDPVDTIKTRMQMELPNPLKLTGLYNGVAGSLVGQVPYGVLTFGSYEIYKEALLKRLPNVKPAFVYALSAILGDITGSGWLCPSEVLKQKLQAGMYSNTGEALRGIWSKGGIGGFYEGYFGGLARDIPFRVAQLTSYEVTKNFYLGMKARKMKANAFDAKERDAISAEKLELSAGDAALCGAIAGSFSAAITSPLDRIKTLLMTDSAAYGGSVASCVGKIWREEGVRGFGAGLVPRVVYIAPSVAIFFIAYEQVQQKLMPTT